MDTALLADDVAHFLEGRISTAEMVRQRSMKLSGGRHATDVVRDGMRDMLGVNQGADPDLERFMQGQLTADELGRRRVADGMPPVPPENPFFDDLAPADDLVGDQDGLLGAAFPGPGYLATGPDVALGP